MSTRAAMLCEVASVALESRCGPAVRSGLTATIAALGQRADARRRRRRRQGENDRRHRRRSAARIGANTPATAHAMTAGLVMSTRVAPGWAAATWALTARTADHGRGTAATFAPTRRRRRRRSRRRCRRRRRRRRRRRQWRPVAMTPATTRTMASAMMAARATNTAARASRAARSGPTVPTVVSARTPAGPESVARAYGSNRPPRRRRRRRRCYRPALSLSPRRRALRHW